MKIAEMESADAVLLVGCNPRHEAPIIGHRLRKAWLKGASLAALNPGLEFVFNPAMTSWLRRNSGGLARIGAPLPTGEPLRLPTAEAGSVKPDGGTRNITTALQHQTADCCCWASCHEPSPRCLLRQLSAWIADAALCPEPAFAGCNPVGAWLAGAVPHRGPGRDSGAIGMNKTVIKSTGKTGCRTLNEYDIDDRQPRWPHCARQKRSHTVFASESLRALRTYVAAGAAGRVRGGWSAWWHRIAFASRGLLGEARGLENPAPRR
jgi:hypothetical protein